MDDISSITLTLINNVSINLSCFHIGMSKHSLNGIDIGVTFKLQGGEGVTAVMVVKPKINRRQTEAVRNLKR